VSVVQRLFNDMLPIGPCILTIGVFDGVHVGHQALIAKAIEQARISAVPSAVLTFDRDPETIVHPKACSDHLLSLEDKIVEIDNLGVDYIVVLPFDSQLAMLSPEVFFEKILINRIQPIQIVVGVDFHFGYRAGGNVADLMAMGATRGIAVTACELISIEGVPVKSTRIKMLVSAGQMESAARLLGRPYRLTGTVVHGSNRGLKLLGVPTANLRLPPGSILPADGVYGGSAQVGATCHPAAISIGSPPSFQNCGSAVEVHLLDFEGDLYGRDVTAQLSYRIREQFHFSSPERLADAIGRDIDYVRQVHKSSDHFGERP